MQGIWDGLETGDFWGCSGFWEEEHPFWGEAGGDASLQQPYLMKKFIEITKKDREFIMKAMDCTERMVFKGTRFEKNSDT